MNPEEVLGPLGPTRTERLALRVLQLGVLAVVPAAATYKVFELDRFFVPKELVLHGTAFLVGLLSLGAVRRVAATRVDLLLLGFLALGLASSAAATNPWAAMRAFGVGASGVVVFWAARGVRRAGLARPLLGAVAVAVVLAALGSLLQAYGVRTELFSLNRAPGGTLGNRNFVAHVTAFGLPVLLLAALRAWRPLGVLLGGVGAAASLGALVLTRSRAAWLAVVLVVGVLLLGTLMSRPLRRDRRLLLRGLLLALLLGGGAAAALYLPNALRWRSDSPYLETARGVVNYREGSGRGRLIQYRNSLRMALDHASLGVGPGNWAVEYPEYASRRDPSLDRTEAGMTANPWPSSDWVALAAERGLPALLLLGLAFVGIAVSGWRRLRRARDSDEGLGALTLLATLVGVATVGAFDAVQLLALPTLLVWAALGALWTPEDARGLDTAPWARVLALLALTLVAGLSAARSAGQLAGMALYASGEGREALELASRMDPGSYRIHLRLARGSGRRGREQRCEHARAAHRLFPHAAEARRLAARCD